MDMKRIIRNIVYNRIRVQRGISFVAIFVATITAVGVWRGGMPDIHWGWLWGIGAMLYLGCAWVIGLLDERFLWRIETEKFSTMNPQLMEMYEGIKRIEKALQNGDDNDG